MRCDNRNVYAWLERATKWLNWAQQLQRATRFRPTKFIFIRPIYRLSTISSFDLVFFPVHFTLGSIFAPFWTIPRWYQTGSYMGIMDMDWRFPTETAHLTYNLSTLLNDNSVHILFLPCYRGMSLIWKENQSRNSNQNLLRTLVPFQMLSDSKGVRLFSTYKVLNISAPRKCRCRWRLNG